VGLVASSSNVCAVVGDVQERSDTIVLSRGLNTVALLEAGSKATGMSPKHAMNVRSREGVVYSAGFISYPRRTEMTRYVPKGFDIRSILREHASHDAWDRSASYLYFEQNMRKPGRPPVRGKYVGDHPPITPLRAATRQDVGGGAAWRVCVGFCGPYFPWFVAQ
jgi:DNA topoisomerase-3